MGERWGAESGEEIDHGRGWAVGVGVMVSSPTRFAEITATRERLWEEFRLHVEPAAAAPFAASGGIWFAGQPRAGTS